MVVAYCANRKLYSILVTAVNSLLCNNPQVEKVYLLVEDDFIEKLNHPKVQFINCNQFDFLIRKGFNITRRFPYMAMVRCFLTKILKEDKVIYLDVDTIVDGDLTELWNWNMGNNCIAARSEYPETSNRDIPNGYFNSGVLLMNLKLMRLLHLDDAWIRLLKCCRFIFPDQDSANFVFKHSIEYLPIKFNVLGDEIYKSEVVVRHYAGITKPWKSNAAEDDIAFWNKYKVDHL